MAVATAQPIAGVPSTREIDIESVYPSVASTLLGQLVGGIMSAAAGLPVLPFRLLVMVVLGALLAPLGLLAYIITKLFGNRYVLTNRSVQVRRMIGGNRLQQVALADVADVVIERLPSQAFLRVGDLTLRNAQGNDLLTIPAIPYPQRFRQIILDARDARTSADESLARIRSRR